MVFFCHHGRGKQAGTFLSALAAPFARLVGWVAAKDGPGYSPAGRKRGVSSVSPPPLFRCCWFGFVGGVEAGSAELAILGQSSTIRRRRCSYKKRTVHISMCPFFGDLRCSCCRKKALGRFPNYRQNVSSLWFLASFLVSAPPLFPNFYSNDGGKKKKKPLRYW